MNKKIKIITTILLIVLMVCSIASVALADEYSPDQYSGTTISGASKIKTIGNQIIYVIRLVGSMAAVAILVVLGLKYMMGSTEEKAEYKKTMIPYLVGALLVFGATWIGTAIYNAVNSMGA